ncbi:MAG: ATP-binding protein [Bacteroidales bacterium]|jgi:hypothetical protein|nr:ATP-binding protein [Bacteroidales bacterium]
MKYLTADFEKEFKKDDGKFDGVKFESLVKELLPMLGIRNLNETKISWDRSRDFEDRHRKIWAECKMYQDNVSIKIISPTLVMAIIDKPNTIYFFSYSPLNSNAIKHLSQFQNNAGVEIIVYDDTTLESLILSNPEITKRFFSKFKYKKIADEHLYTTQINFSKDPEIEYYGEEIEDPKIKKLYIYSIFSIDIFIRNLSATEKLKGQLSISDSASDALFLLNRSIRNDGKTLKLNIPRGNLFFHRFYFKAMKCGKINLPNFILKLDSPKKEEIVKLKSKTIHVSSIIKTPLIGKEYTEMLDRFKKLALNRSQPIFVNVSGESGTGKSRILQEYSEVLFGEDFNILKFNGEDTSEINFEFFIKKVLSRIYKLPLIQTEQSADTAKTNEFAYDLLYNPTFTARDKVNECIDLFLAGIQTNKVALIIDNLQNFDEAGLDFINGIVSRMENTPAKFVLISCFNTNLIYRETKAFDLFERFKLKNDKNTFLNEEVVGFDDNAYELYLDNCIKPIRDEDDEPFSLKYPKTTELFKEHVLNRPLFIEQTLLYLEQNGAVERSDDRLYVSNISTFNTILKQDFPKNLGELIYKRWELAKSNNKNNRNINLKSVEDTLKFLCVFNKIDCGYVEKYDHTTENIRFLERLGFLKIDEKEKVSFYHHQLFLCFYKKYIREYSQKDYSNYLNFLKNNSITNIFFHQYFILLEKLNAVEEEVLRKAIDKVFLDFQYEDFLIPFVRSLHKILLNNKINIEKNTVLDVFLRLGRILQVFQNLNEHAALLQESGKFILENEAEFMKYGISYANFNHELANACIAVHKDSEALKVLEKTAKDIPNYDFKDTIESDTSLGKVYNRLCVVYKAVDLKEDALNFGNDSLEIAKKIGCDELAIKNYIDIANVYGRDIKNKSQILSLWKSAAILYNSNKNEMSSQRAMLQLYEAQIHLLEGNNEKGIQLLYDGVKYCEAHSIFFFGVKYLLLIVLSNISLNVKMDHAELQSCINKAIDWSIRYQVNRSYWKVLFLEGKFYQKFKAKDEDIISEIFLQSIEQFQLAVTNSQAEEYNIDHFIALSCFFRGNKNKEKSRKYIEMTKSLRSIVVREKINSIMQMNDDEFASFLGTCTPRSVYNDGKFDYPIIG